MQRANAHEDRVATAEGRTNRTSIEETRERTRWPRAGAMDAPPPVLGEFNEGRRASVLRTGEIRQYVRDLTPHRRKFPATQSALGRAGGGDRVRRVAAT